MRNVSNLSGLLKSFQLIDHFKVNNPRAIVLVWLEGTGVIRSYSDRIIDRKQGRSPFRGPQFVQNVYFDQRMVKCTMDIVKTLSQGSNLFWLLIL